MIVLYAIFSNFIFLIFFAIACVSSKHQIGLFTIGAVLQGFSAFGAVSRMFRVPESINLGDLLSVILFVIFVIVGYFLLKRIMRKKEDGKEKNSETSDAPQ